MVFQFRHFLIDTILSKLPLGAPLSVTQVNHAIVGGTGAFLGVRGQVGDTPATIAARSASITEDPAAQRKHGGGKGRLVLHLIPMSWPQIASTVNGQAAEVANAIEWPGPVDTYRVDFRIPSGTAPGTASIQLKAAWIAGASVEIPVQ